MVLQIDSQPENSIFVRIIQRRHHPEILNSLFGLRPKIDIPLNAANPPKILTFQIRACTPPVNLQGQHIFTGLQVLVYLKLSRILGVFVIPHFPTVQIHIGTRLGSTNMQVNITSVPICRNFNVPPIHTDRIFFRQQRGLRISRLKLITVIRIDSHSEALSFPIARHLYIMP